VPFLIEQLRSEELSIRDAALHTIREIPDAALAAALNAELARARPELQRPLVLALADCHNPQSIPALETVANGADPAMRATALMVLGRIGPEAAPALLTALQKDGTAEDKAVVVSGLKAMNGPPVDDLLLEALSGAAKPGTKVDLIRLLGGRGTAKASGEILKQAAGADKEVSLAALSALQSLAGANEVPGLIALLKSCQDQAIRDAAESALAGACSRSGGQGPGADAVLAELTHAAGPAARNCWVRVLATVGYAKALPAIETAAGDADEAVANNALAQLGRWPDPAPMDTLLKATGAAASPSLRQRALVSVIDLATTAADEGKTPEAAISRWMQRADPVAQTIGEKRRILGILGRLKTVESFRLLAPYLDDPNLRTEAASGVVQIAPALAAGPEAGALKSALEKIAATVTNPDLRDRALKAAKAIR
jgi:HEAT repeat protein